MSPTPGTASATAATDALALDALLVKTSRTFALSIPLLPEPTRHEVGVAYLLFRIADTFEDAVGWPRERRLAALAELGELLRDPFAAAARAADWVQGPPAIPHAGDQELLAAAPLVFDAYGRLAAAARAAIHHHLGRTVEGMARFVAHADAAGRLALGSLGELRDYCYVVAGIVGEMLTDLFLLDQRDLAPLGLRLRERAALFGEGLQLVNILKDAGGDEREGRSFLPSSASLASVFDLARADLRAAGEYVRTLQEGGAPRGLVAFTALPVLLARASLLRVETAGAGAKLSRDEVRATAAALETALDRGEPAVP